MKMIVCVGLPMFGPRLSKFLCADKMQGAKPRLNGW